MIADVALLAIFFALVAALRGRRSNTTTTPPSLSRPRLALDRRVRAGIAALFFIALGSLIAWVDAVADYGGGAIAGWVFFDGPAPEEIRRCRDLRRTVFQAKHETGTTVLNARCPQRGAWTEEADGIHCDLHGAP